MLERLSLVRALQGGTRVMRDMGEVFLPRHPRETEDHYVLRLRGTFLFNVFERAIKNMADKPFSMAPTVTGGDADLERISMNMDRAGTDMQSFGRQFLTDILRSGVGWLIVDFPRLAPARNLAEERERGALPYMIHVRPDDVLGYRYSTESGQRQYTHFRYMSSRVVQDGRFGEKTVRTIMVLEPGTWEEWTDETGSWAIAASGTMSMQQLPIVELRVGELDASGMVRSPFEDLAWKNVEHWQSSSDQRNILRYARFPMLAAKGYKPSTVGGKEKPLEIGPAKILVTPPDGEFYYVEPEGKALESGEKDIDRIEAQMEYLALRPRVDKRSLITATGAAIEEVDENNVVKALALSVGNALEEAMILAGKWLGRDWSSVSVSLNGDFEVSSDRGQSVETILRLLDGDSLTIETALEELRALGVFRSRFDVKSEVTAVKALQEEKRQQQIQDKKTDMGAKTGLPGAVPSNVNV